jgi:hypothetical protein
MFVRIVTAIIVAITMPHIRHTPVVVTFELADTTGLIACQGKKNY